MTQLSKRAMKAVEAMKSGAYWRKRLERQWRGGEKFEYRLVAGGSPMAGYGFKTWLEMSEAGLLKSKPCPSSSTFREEWSLSEQETTS